MRRRLYAVVVVAALGFALPSHAEDPKKLDGDKVKKIEAKGTAELQAHDEEQVISNPNKFKCDAARCLRVDFIFEPVAGATGDVVIQTTWGNRLSDIDLYLVDSASKQVALCAFTGGTREIISIAHDKLVKGEKYTAIAYYFRSVGEEVTTTVEFPSKNPIVAVTDEPGFDCAL